MEIADDIEEIKPPKNDYSGAWLFAIFMVTITPALVSLTAPTAIEGAVLKTLMILLCAALWNPKYKILPLKIVAAGIGIFLWLDVQISFLEWLNKVLF